VIFNEDDFGKGTDSSRSESESAEETIVEIPVESEEETDDPVSEEEVNSQPILPRHSE